MPIKTNIEALREAISDRGIRRDPRIIITGEDVATRGCLPGHRRAVRRVRAGPRH